MFFGLIPAGDRRHDEHHRVIVNIAAGFGPDSAVLVEDDHIVAVVGLREIPSGYSLIDLSQGWLMPGLIDMHVHLLWDGSADPGRCLVHELDQLARAGLSPAEAVAAATTAAASAARRGDPPPT